MHTPPTSGSGSADASADLTGNDPFAALLAQVAPSDVTAKSDATAKTADQNGRKGKDKNTPVSSDANGTQTAAKSDGTNDPTSAGTTSNPSAQPIAAQSTDPSQGDPSQADSTQTDPSQIDPSQTGTSKTAASQGDPSKIDPSQIAATNVSDGAQTKITDPDAALPKAKGAAKNDAKTNADSDTKTGTKNDAKADKKGDKKSDTEAGSNLAANAALIPIPIAAAANFLPIALALATPGTSDGADDPATDIVSAAGAGAGAKGAAPTGTAQGQGAAKTAKNSLDLTDPDDTPDGIDPDDAVPKTGKATDSAADKKNAKPDPKQAGPQTPTRLNADPSAVLQKQPSQSNSDSSQARASQSTANAPAPQPAAQIALATPPSAPAPGPAPLPGMPAPAQSAAMSAPQSAPSMPATLQAAPQTPANMVPNLNLFALNIAARAQGGLRQFDITMDPADLGRVNVSLSIDSTGKTEAHLRADQPQTLALLQQDSSNLRIALRNAGLNVAQNGLNFSLNGQNPGQHNAKNTSGGRGRALSIRAVAAVGAAQSVLPVFSSTGANTRLDIHV